MSVLATLQGKTTSERSAIKVAEHVRLAPLGRHTAGRDELEIRSVALLSNGAVEVFIRAWRDGKPLGFGPDGEAEIERTWIANPPIMVPDPLGSYNQSWTDPDTKEIHKRTFREDPAQALIDVLAHSVQLVGRTDTNVVPGRIASTHGDMFPLGGTGTAPMDDAPQREGVNDTFSTIRAGAGTLIEGGDAGFVQLNASTTFSQYAKMVRSGFGFPTDQIPDGDIISAATLSIWGVLAFSSLDHVNMGITSFSPVDEDTFAASDFAVANWGGTDFATRVGTAAFNLGSYENFTLNASGISHISDTAVTHFGLRTAWDIDNSFGGTWGSTNRSGILHSMAEDGGAGTTQDPKLVVTHAPSFIPYPNPRYALTGGMQPMSGGI